MSYVLAQIESQLDTGEYSLENLQIRAQNTSAEIRKQVSIYQNVITSMLRKAMAPYRLITAISPMCRKVKHRDEVCFPQKSSY